MVEMTLQRIRKCSRTGQSVLLLKEKTGERFLPISLPPKEEQILRAALANAPTRRSDVYGLLTMVLARLGGRLEAVALNVASDDELKASLKVDSGSGPWQVEAHPVDALALALRQGSPILLDAEALEKEVLRSRRQDDAPDCSREQDRSGVNEGDGSDSLPPVLRDFLSTLDLNGLDRNT